MKIVTTHVFPPIPIREFDWSATLDDCEPGCPVGWGATEADAVADLEGLLADKAESDMGREDADRELCAAVAKELRHE